jgi:hypothetical protein
LRASRASASSRARRPSCGQTALLERSGPLTGHPGAGRLRARKQAHCAVRACACPRHFGATAKAFQTGRSSPLPRDGL